MDALLIFFRVIHVGSAMTWFGGAIVSSFFLQPTVAAVGVAGQPFMEHLMNRRKLGVMFPIVGALTVLSGAVLYWRDSAGLQQTWITSPTGLAFTIGGLAAIIAFVGGGVLIGPGVAEQTAVRGELAWATVCQRSRNRHASTAPIAASRWRVASICHCSCWRG